MSDAREVLTLRNLLQQWLAPDEIRAVAWHVVTHAAADAVARGWTGDELARWCIADLGGIRPDSPGAVILTTLRRLAQTDPPRDTTPAPRNVTEYRRDRAKAVSESEHVDHAGHVQAIKAALRYDDPRL